MRARKVRRSGLLRVLWRSLALLGVALVIFGATGGAWRMADAHSANDRPPGGVLSDPVVRAVDIAAPAVVRIATLYQVSITFGVCGQALTLPPSGPGYTVGALGSGAFISAHGDILTADHVVDVDTASLDQELLQDPQIAQTVADWLNHLSCVTQPISAASIANGSIQIPYQTNYSQPQRLVWRDTDYTGPLSTSPQNATDLLIGLEKAQSWTAQVLATSSFQQDDVAIVHINLDDTPSITLDDSSNVAVMDPLTVIGFPGNGDTTSSGVTGDPTNLLTPSVNLASVSAIKTNDDGSALIQVGGNIEHGDSGGPALDAQGHIVGVVSFGGLDTQGITAFLRSSDSAKSVIAGTTVSMQPGAFEQKWRQAFDDYAATSAGHWHVAARELDALVAAYPDFKGALPYQQYADRAAATEAAPGIGLSLDPVLLGSIASLILGLALLGVLLFLLWQPSRPRPALAPAAATRPMLSGYGGYGGYGGSPNIANYPPYPPYPGYGGYPGYPNAAPIYGDPAPPTLPPAAIRQGGDVAPTRMPVDWRETGALVTIPATDGAQPVSAGSQASAEHIALGDHTLSELNATPMGRMSFGDESAREKDRGSRL